ncbi:hypothetical protein XACJK4_1420052 [Xanthomonas citri pv. citri]|nr:hypothetical protein XAC1083_430076 [Xanthomonas citri pv. citri]CEE43655.1 hypothetical protein XAC908_590075 [Xanthomonas citri pv. citri]CEE60538.1 hypothetical protein XAC71A_530026 [Xanthomonas citri pv. citri]CEE77566.1 hypothetical protein XAC3608_930016 [Xanthomonas citri pv. citri]CEE87568.1 hypothetical protein XACLE20_780016 [Xanthomonas citri pv. citri]
MIPTGLTTGHVRHAPGDRAASHLGAVEVQTGLQDAVGQQVVEAGIGPLDDERWQRGHGAGGALDHVAHDRLEAVRDPVELVPQRGRDAHVAADQVAVPAHADPDALHVPRRPHRHRPAAADAVEHIAADDAAARADAVLVDACLCGGCGAERRQNDQRGNTAGTRVATPQRV